MSRSDKNSRYKRVPLTALEILEKQTTPVVRSDKMLELLEGLHDQLEADQVTLGDVRPGLR